LLSWRPRHPSPALKRRIFQESGDLDLPTVRWLWGCFAPTMACALLALVALNREGAGLSPKVAVAQMLSNQSSAAFATGGGSAPENHLATVTFGWTNDSVFKSSIRFTPSTNF